MFTNKNDENKLGRVFKSPVADIDFNDIIENKLGRVFKSPVADIDFNDVIENNLEIIK